MAKKLRDSHKALAKICRREETREIERERE